MTSEKTKSKNTGVIVGAVSAVAVAAAAFAGAGGAVQLPGFSHAAPLHLTRVAFAPPPGAPLSFADIFEKVSPAVVSINVTSKVDVSQLQGGGNNPFGFPFLGPNGGGQGGQGQGRGGRRGGPQAKPDTPDDSEDEGPTAEASGSGFFISADGYIVTNNHVVENAKTIKIVLKDKRELTGTVVGTDENTDLAVVKVEGHGFPFVNFENSATPRVGDWVIAIGNPFGLSATATAGIVSAYDRNLPDDSSSFVDYLQIDAPINPGNSGGPTFDLYGRVIGVNSAIYSPGRGGGGSVGIGFAIPSSIAESITKQLISGGKITRGYLGAGIRPFTKELAEGIGIDTDKDSGAFVQSITKGGPAEKAGLKVGDVIMAVNGVKVADATALTRAVAATHSGDNLKLDIIREGKPMTLNAKSGLRPTPKELAANDTGGDADTGPAHKGDDAESTKPTVLGLSVSPLDAATRKHIQAPESLTGLVVSDVARGSAGAKAALQPGDIISMARGVPVNTPADLLAAVEAQKRSNHTSIMLMVTRGADTGPVLLDFPKENGKG
jgi:serine protease Do